jgi:transposase
MNQPILSMDVSKSKSCAAAYLSYGKPFQKPVTVEHSPTGMAFLVNLLEELEEKTRRRPEIVLEATGRYSKPIVSFFRSNGYTVIELNPLETHQMRKQSIRKVKTDLMDLDRIAQAYYLNDFLRGPEMEPIILELRNLCRQHIGFSKLYTQTQLRFRSILDLLFPNYDQVFSDLCGKTSLDLLSRFPTPQSISTADREDLLSVFQSARKSEEWREKKVDQLLNMTRESLPDSTGVHSNRQSMLSYIEMIRTQQKVLQDIRKQIQYWASQIPAYELLLSIPGVGEITASAIISEIGDIKRFPTSKQLVAFAGLDPSVFESGKFKASHNRISKRGSTYLRNAVYQATVAAVTKRKNGPVNPILFEYYSKKLEEGKPKRVAMIATCNKLIRIIYGILTNRQPFDMTIKN